MAAEVFFNHASELATVTNTFAVDGTNTDPTTITLVVTDPDGGSNTYTYAASQITRDSAGVYHKDVSCASTTPGVWTATWVGTGTATDVTVATWNTVSTDLSGLYCTPELLKDRTGIADSLDDVAILAACRSVTRWINRHCGRHFNKTAATKTFPPTDWYCLTVPDLVSVTTLKTDAAGDGTFETTWSSSDYQLLPANAAVEVEPEPYTEIQAIGSQTFPVPSWSNLRMERVQIVGVWGWPEVPAPIVEAAKILSGDYLKLGAMAFGVAGYGEYGAVRARMSNPALEMLAPYRLNPIRIG